MFFYNRVPRRIPWGLTLTVRAEVRKAKAMGCVFFEEGASLAEIGIGAAAFKIQCEVLGAMCCELGVWLTLPGG